jgi:hypothetical protein
MLYDRELPDEGPMGNRVMVYSTVASDPQPFTSWEAGVDAGQQWREARLNTSVVVRVMRYGNASAVVRLCRWAEEAETACGDGLDNDCDGRVDGDDPDCTAGAPQGGGGGGGGGSGASVGGSKGGSSSGGASKSSDSGGGGSGKSSGGGGSSKGGGGGSSKGGSGGDPMSTTTVYFSRRRSE